MFLWSLQNAISAPTRKQCMRNISPLWKQAVQVLKFSFKPVVWKKRHRHNRLSIFSFVILHCFSIFREVTRRKWDNLIKSFSVEKSVSL